MPLELKNTNNTGFFTLINQNNSGNFILTNSGVVLTTTSTTTTTTTLAGVTGSIDPSFNIGTGFDFQVLDFEIQSDDKVIAGGTFLSYNGTTRNRIARINTDGTYDSTFNIGTGFDAAVNNIAVQSDGKILVVGNFTSYSGSACNRIVRLNTDGTIDPSFSIGTGFNNDVRDVVIQSDGKILASGVFTDYNGTTRNRITRLNTDGTNDSSFSVGTGFNSHAYDIAIQSDGKIILVGTFTTYNGNTSNRIIRINADGTYDSTFNVGTGFNDWADDVTIQPDGKILVGGWFTSYNGTGRNRIIRLNTNGTIDSSFNVGTGFNSTVETMAIQSDGKVIVAGQFTSYNGNSINRIIRLNSDGSYDSTFNTGTGFNEVVWVIAFNSSGKLIAGGNFTSYNGTTQNRLIRIL